MKKSITLSPAEYSRIVDFVQDVRSLVDNDEESILIDIYDSLEVVEEILDIQQEKEELDDEA